MKHRPFVIYTPALRSGNRHHVAPMKSIAIETDKLLLVTEVDLRITDKQKESIRSDRHQYTALVNVKRTLMHVMLDIGGQGCHLRVKLPIAEVRYLGMIEFAEWVGRQLPKGGIVGTDRVPYIEESDIVTFNTTL